MDNALTRAIILLSTKRYRHAGEEQDDLEMLLASVGPYRQELLRWELEEGKRFVDPRKQAGLTLFRENPSQVWSILEKLVASSDPDDRDTACETLQEINEPRAYPLVKPLLHDQYPYLQLEACDFLKNIYPDEVTRTLTELLQNPNESIQIAAKELLSKLG